MTKVVLGLDLDDVSAKYTDGLRRFIIDKHIDDFEGKPLEEIMALFPDLPTYDGFPWPYIDNDYGKFRELHAEAVENGLFQHLSPMQGVSEALWRLNDAGYHIRVITSRFVKHGQNARVVGDTGIWLDKNKIPYRDIMFVQNKVDVYADIYIDDSPKNIANLRGAGRKVIAFDQSYNRTFGDDLRVKSWAEAEQVLLQHLAETA